jgi:hypothetical protein
MIEKKNRKKINFSTDQIENNIRLTFEINVLSQ